MEGLHEVAELVERPVAVVRREVRDRVVAPEVADGRVELEDGKQLDRSDPEVGEVLDLLAQAGERPRSRDAGRGRAGKAADVELVDDRVRERPAERTVALPVVARAVSTTVERRDDPTLSPGCAARPRSQSDVTTSRAYGSRSALPASKRSCAPAGPDARYA
jgi:hypothetical protein